MPPQTIAYYLAFTAILFVLLVSLYKDDYGKKIPYVALMVLLVLFSGLRYQVGWDYHIYEYGYSNSFGDTLNHMEPFWHGLRKVMHYLGLPVEVWFFLTSAFIVIFSLRAYRLQSSNFAIAALSFVVIFSLYFESFNTVRQTCAQVVVLYGFPFFKKKKYLQTLLILLLAFMLHKTALLMLVFLPLCFVHYNRILVALGMFLGATLGPPLIRELFLALIHSNILEGFYINEAFLRTELYRVGLGTIVKMAFVFYLLYREPELLRKDPTLRPYLNAFYFAILLNLMLYRVFVLGSATRFTLYFVYFTPILLSNLFTTGIRWDRIAVGLYLLFETVNTIIFIHGDKTKYDRYYLYDTVFFDREAPMKYPGNSSLSSLSPPQGDPKGIFQTSRVSGSSMIISEGSDVGDLAWRAIAA